MHEHITRSHHRLVLVDFPFHDRDTNCTFRVGDNLSIRRSLGVICDFVTWLGSGGVLFVIFFLLAISHLYMVILGSW